MVFWYTVSLGTCINMQYGVRGMELFVTGAGSEGCSNYLTLITILYFVVSFSLTSIAETTNFVFQQKNKEYNSQFTHGIVTCSRELKVCRYLFTPLQ